MQNNNRTVIVVVVLIIIILGIVWYTTEGQKDIYSDEALAKIGIVDAPKEETSGLIAEQNMNKPISLNQVKIETNKGVIIFETYDNDAPKTVENFISLANKGFYNGLIFHRVIKDFMIQGGDPTGTGAGGPGYKFADELNPETISYKNGYQRGVVAMANAGPNTNGSQFFIMHKDTPLPNNYTIFGKVISGMDVVDAIANTATDGNDRPIEKMIMNKVTVTPVAK